MTRGDGALGLPRPGLLQLLGKVHFQRVLEGVPPPWGVGSFSSE
jgi:hypothetical protein